MCKQEYIGKLNTLVWESTNSYETFESVCELCEIIAFDDDLTNAEYVDLIEYANALVNEDLNIDCHISV